LSPEYCFVVEDENTICGYALGVADARAYYRKLKESWIPEMKRKYPFQEAKSSPLIDKFVQELHGSNSEAFFNVPDLIFDTYPSFLNLTVMSSIQDLSVPKRMLACLISTLKANGQY